MLVAVALGVAAASTGSAHAQARPPFGLTVPKVREAPVPREDTVAPSWVAFGPGGEVSVLPAGTFPADSTDAAMLDVPGRIRPRRTGVLVMADGQRMVGDLQVGIGSPAWSMSWRGPVPLTVDGVRALVLDGGDPPAAAELDRVFLRNGDEATGIVSAITDAGIELEQGSGDGRAKRTISFESVRAVSFVAPPAQRAGVRAWLDDGSVVDGTSLSWRTDGSVALALAGTDPVELPDGAVAAVQRAPGVAVPLAALVPAASEPEEGRGMRLTVPMPAIAPGTWALDAPPVEIEGPVALSYPAAGGARRLVATAVRPRRASAAGTVDVVIRAVGRELLRHRFAPGDLRLDVRVDLPDGPFEILLLPADGSFVGDVVVLERALLLAR